jgi:hypothetical protein
MMELRDLILVGSILLGPGAGVWVAVWGLRHDNERFYGKLSQIEEHLRVLNHRVTTSEGDIRGLERREDQ